MDDAELDLIERRIAWHRDGRMAYPDNWYEEDVPRLLAEVRRLQLAVADLHDAALAIRNGPDVRREDLQPG